MPMVELTCFQCGNTFYKPQNEVNRKLRKGCDKFFCSISCGAKHSNKDKKAKEITKICPHCGEPFETTTKRGAKEFCSRSCASAGSVTEHRRSQARIYGKQNLIPFSTVGSIAHLMEIRESWKYTRLREYLDQSEISYRFEYPLGSYIYDLALLDKHILVEFDGTDHNYTEQRSLDFLKDLAAHNEGWTVLRIKVENNTIIPVEPLKEYL